MPVQGKSNPRTGEMRSRDYFTFVLPVHKHFLQSNAKTVHELNGTDPVTLSSTVPVPYQYRTSTVPVTDPVPAPVRKLLSALKNGPLSPAELRTAVGVQHRQTFRENYINPAIRADLICAEDGLSPHDPRIRYSLTDKGMSTLDGVAEKITENTEEVAEKVAENTGEVAEKLNDTEKRIIALVRENSHITQRMLSSMIGLTRQYVGRCMDSLQARQIIRRIGPDKGGKWVIKKVEVPK